MSSRRRPIVPTQETSIEDAPLGVPLSEDEQKLVDRAREEFARTGRSFTSEELRKLLREKRQRAG